MMLHGYARVSVREPEDKNLDLQVERLVRAGCSLAEVGCAFRGLDDDRKDSTATHITLRPQLGGHRQCV